MLLEVLLSFVPRLITTTSAAGGEGGDIVSQGK